MRVVGRKVNRCWMRGRGGSYLQTVSVVYREGKSDVCAHIIALRNRASMIYDTNHVPRGLTASGRA